MKPLERATVIGWYLKQGKRIPWPGGNKQHEEVWDSRMEPRRAPTPPDNRVPKLQPLTGPVQLRLLTPSIK